MDLEDACFGANIFLDAWFFTHSPFTFCGSPSFPYLLYVSLVPLFVTSHRPVTAQDLNGKHICKGCL